MNRRRALSALLALGLAPAMQGRAQSPRRIAVITWRGGLMSHDGSAGREFLAAMKQLGYAERRDFVYDERLWERQEQAAGLVRELIALKPDVLIAPGPPSILAAKAGTERVPIVMMYSAEPVEMGIVRSLNRPGGNITGLTWDHGFETALKALELLKETLPRLRRVALLWDETDSVHPVYARHFEKGAPQLRLALLSVPVRELADVEPALTRMKSEKADALVILPSGQLTVPHRVQILETAMQAGLPTLYAYVGRDAPNALLQYGPDLSAMPRRAATYVDRIFKGAKPGDIPVEQPDKYDLIVDLGAARKLGIRVPRSILMRADGVIE